MPKRSLENRRGGSVVSDSVPGLRPSRLRIPIVTVVFIALVGLTSSSCASWPFFVTAAKNLLMVAAGNYSGGYKEEVRALLAALVSKKDAPPAAGERLELELGVLRQAVIDHEQVPMPIKTGDTLHDGAGDPEKGDRFKISVRANQDCYVYVVGIDATGWVSPIFPSSSSSASNPVRGGAMSLVPSEGKWFRLDEYRGVETVYCYASKRERPDLKAILASFDGRKRPRSIGSDRVSVAHEIRTRGIVLDETRKANIRTESGKSFAVELGRILAESGSGDLVVSTWFHHK